MRQVSMSSKGKKSKSVDASSISFGGNGVSIYAQYTGLSVVNIDGDTRDGTRVAWIFNKNAT